MQQIRHLKVHRAAKTGITRLGYFSVTEIKRMIPFGQCTVHSWTTGCEIYQIVKKNMTTVGLLLLHVFSDWPRCNETKCQQRFSTTTGTVCKRVGDKGEHSGEKKSARDWICCSVGTSDVTPLFSGMSASSQRGISLSHSRNNMIRNTTRCGRALLAAIDVSILLSVTPPFVRVAPGAGCQAILLHAFCQVIHPL